jgi:hypothetical protein
MLAAFCVLTIGLPSLCFGKTLTYPSVVHADANGEWSAEITVEGTPDPNFHIVTYWNIDLCGYTPTPLGGGKWKIQVVGHLEEGKPWGYIIFRVDPEGDYVEGTINVRSPSNIPTVSEWGLIVMGLLLLTAGAVVIARRRVRPI